MTKELKPWTFNAKKWRRENGYTSPEWEMYVKNRIVYDILFLVAGILIGVMMVI